MSVESFAMCIPRNYLQAGLTLLIFLCLGTLVASLAIAAPVGFSPDVDQEQIDSTGLVWAAKHYGSQLYTYDGQSWKTAANGLGPDGPAEFRGMATMADGAVVVVWIVQGQGLAVTRHLGPSSTVLGAEKGDNQKIPNLIRPTMDSKGRVWLGGSFPRIYRTDGKGGVTLVHKFVPEDFSSREKKRMITSDLYNPIHCEEDGLGRMWVWSGTTGSIVNQWGKNPNLDSSPSLHGIYLISGDKVELHDDLGAIKGGDFYSVARFDNRHMIISDSENGVYKIDIESWRPENLPGSTPLELKNVHELFVDGSEIYAFDRLSGTNLWRWSNEQWTDVVPDFENNSAGIGYSPRTWLRTKDGMVIQAFEHEAWFLPHTGPARTLSWKSTFPISKIKAIVQLKDGTFCVLVNESQIFYCEIANPTNNGSSNRIVEVEPDVAWLSSKHIWMIPRKDSTALKEWDGKTWLIHPIPNKGRGDVMLNEDEQGMIWVYNYDGSANVLDPVKNQWQSFGRFDDCLAATKGHPVHFQHSWRGPFPRYSSDKQQIAYYASTWQAVHYFNGSVWRFFKWTDISGWPGDVVLNPPWFDAKDKLCVSTRANTMWQFDENGKWSSVPFIEHSSDDYDSPEKTKFRVDNLPEGCPIRNPHSIQTDNLGTFWFTKDTNLYRCIGDQCVSIFAPDEITPFNSTPYLLEVEVDSQGNAFIKTLAAETRRYLILAKRPAPQTTIALKRMDEDSFIATFNPHSDGGTNFRWQLEDGPSQLIKTDSLTLDHLANGSHILKVTAIDDQLNMDAMPSTAKFETKINPSRQMALLVAQLSDPDFSKRKLAVEALAWQPAVALPALRKVRESATEDQRWWIDAAIQECEGKAAASPKK
jgi:hypothetical protein